MVDFTDDVAYERGDQLTRQRMAREYLRRRDAMVLAMEWFKRPDIDKREALETVAETILKFLENR